MNDCLSYQKALFLMMIIVSPCIHGMQETPIRSLADLDKFAGKVVVYATTEPYLEGKIIDDYKTCVAWISPQRSQFFIEGKKEPGYNILRLIGNDQPTLMCAVTTSTVGDADLIIRETDEEERKEIYKDCVSRIVRFEGRVPYPLLKLLGLE